MKTFNHFTLIILATMTVACNEKISPKLLDANQSTTVPPVIEPEEYYFKVINTSPAIRKYHLHKSGVGNYDSPCAIKSTSKFSSSLFRDPQRRHEFDISCIFEAEELAMQQKGFNIKFEASANTCEFVGYAPFSFYNFKPGSSSATYTVVNCGAGVTDAGVATSPDAGLRPSSDQGALGCNSMVLDEGPTGIESVNARAFSHPGDENLLCRYDYSQLGDGPNCDIGTIVINEINYEVKPPENEGDPEIIVGSKGKPRIIKCGGDISACISGPIKQETGSEGLTAIISVYETVKNEPFSAEREYSTPPSEFGPMYYTNFRRNLASPDIDFIFQPEAGKAGFTNYTQSFEGFTNFTPLVMENYAASKFFNGVDDLVPLPPKAPDPDSFWIDNITVNPDGTLPIQKGVSYAAEPFMGLKRTNPFYTFYCFDSAAEIRARVKMVVRDWDRYFSSDRTLFNLISDIDKGINARMDNPLGFEIPGDGDSVNSLNDFPDWDDFLRMTRTPGPVSNVTIWSPAKGFHHPDNFPQFTGVKKPEEEE